MESEDCKANKHSWFPTLASTEMSSARSEPEASSESRNMALVKCEPNSMIVSDSNRPTNIPFKEPTLTFSPVPLHIIASAHFNQIEQNRTSTSIAKTPPPLPPLLLSGKWFSNEDEASEKMAQGTALKSRCIPRVVGPIRRSKPRRNNLLPKAMTKRLILAAGTNNTDWMLETLNNGYSPRVADEGSRTLLHIASSRGYTHMVQILLSYGADPNARDCQGSTPLHLAAVNTNIAVVACLLQAGTNVRSRDKRGQTPLQLACSKLKLLGDLRNGEFQKVRQEVHIIVNMLAADFRNRLPNTSDQADDDVQNLLEELDSLNIAR